MAESIFPCPRDTLVDIFLPEFGEQRQEAEEHIDLVDPLLEEEELDG